MQKKILTAAVSAAVLSTTFLAPGMASAQDSMQLEEVVVQFLSHSSLSPLQDLRQN